MKMVQQKVTASRLVQLMHHSGPSSSDDPMSMYVLPDTTVKVQKSQSEEEMVDCLRGNVPHMTGDEIFVGYPSPECVYNTSCPSENRSTAFEATEYFRLLHVLADPCMNGARIKVMQCLNREELDRQYEDPWCEQTAPLFNDLSFIPSASTTLTGGITSSDIHTLDPADLSYIRKEGVLKRKFVEFESIYG